MKILSIVITSILASSAFAAQTVTTKIYNPYSSIRALGMGNAFTAVADDYTLILYNPAGFARKKHNEVQFSLVGAGVSSKTLTLTSDISKASDTQGTDAAKAQAVSDALEKYYGEALGGKIQAIELFWVRNGWGFAFLPLDMTIDMSINRQLGPAIDLNIRGDSTFAIGYGKEVYPNVDAGITLKYVHRVSVEEILPAFELASDPNILSDSRFKEGTKFDFDIGGMWRPNWFNKGETGADVAKVDAVKPVVTETINEEKKPDEAKPEEKKSEEPRTPQAEGEPKEVMVAQEEKPAEGPAAAADVVAVPKNIDLPSKEETKKADVVASNDGRYPLTLAAVMHNVIGSEFTLSKMANKNATEVPTKMYRTIDLGSQYMIRDGEDFKIRAMIDLKNLLHPEVNFNKAFHTGFELDYSPSTWFKTQFRVGLNQMYYTAGASFLFAVLNIDVATYGEDVGTAETKKENRVLAAKVGFNF